MGEGRGVQDKGREEDATEQVRNTFAKKSGGVTVRIQEEAWGGGGEQRAV